MNALFLVLNTSLRDPLTTAALVTGMPLLVLGIFGRRTRQPRLSFTKKDLFALSAGNLLVQFGCSTAPTYLHVLIDGPQEEKERSERDDPDKVQDPACIGYQHVCA